MKLIFIPSYSNNAIMYTDMQIKNIFGVFDELSFNIYSDFPIFPILLLTIQVLVLSQNYRLNRNSTGWRRQVKKLTVIVIPHCNHIF